MREAVAAARRILEDATAAHVFPAASVDVGDSSRALWTAALGTLTFDDGSPPAAPRTLFDLASVTKVVATTSIVMELVRTGRVRLEDPVARYCPAWIGGERAPATIASLLEHASGLPARLGAHIPSDAREFAKEIATIRLEYAPGSRSVYSDLDFILLGLIAQDAASETLDQTFRTLCARWKIDGDLGYGVRRDARTRTAPTEPLPGDVRTGRLLAGEVQDTYAAALGGVAGHAGLFGTASAVGTFARMVLRAARGARTEPEPFAARLVDQFTTRTHVDGSSRALGWDTMLPTSSCGTRMSDRAFGHAGYTGTSLWIDPVRDRYFVLLSNRACGGGTLEEMRDVRRAFHDALGSL